MLADTKLIAEPWDAAGLYQVGRFPVRPPLVGMERPIIATTCAVSGAASRAWPATWRRGYVRQCRPLRAIRAGSRVHSINFITCHDGFTLYDLVSYNNKHNDANGEGNRDGTERQLSAGIAASKGRRTIPTISDLRLRQAKNLMATLMLSQGVPMILAGDEFLRTQSGNNNAWCQDNEISWIDWSLHAPACRIRAIRPGDDPLPQMHRPRAAPPRVSRRRCDRLAWRSSAPSRLGPAEVNWSHITLDGQRTGRESDCDIYVVVNGADMSVTVSAPCVPNGGIWQRRRRHVAKMPR